MNTTPTSSRLHIAIFGRRNAGKSSIINAITNQEIALVSEFPGTTTDPVIKAMEILPIGPVAIIDTAGLDDVGILGNLRVKKTYEILNKTDMAILVIDGTVGVSLFEEDIAKKLKDKGIPIIGVINKKDLSDYTVDVKKSWERKLKVDLIEISAEKKEGIENLKQSIINKAPLEDNTKLIGDIIEKKDIVILVVPIDSAAPKGRLILPQQQVIRDIIDNGGIAVVTQVTELSDILKIVQNPSLVITDSQVFDKVASIIPKQIPLTSFSVLYARYKGDLGSFVKAIEAINNLKDNDKVLISEGCTHHRQDDDIGTVKIPNWLTKKTGKNIKFSWSSGMTFPEDLESYSLIIHCGACMLNRKEMLYRINFAEQKGVPIINYGIFIAYVNDLIPRAIEIFTNKKQKKVKF
ncbi:MAG: [FeFe] hydrogenase H-cluster maturation GTPase HydF [Thermoanaerobacteraceae bacterium]